MENHLYCTHTEAVHFLKIQTNKQVNTLISIYNVVENTCHFDYKSECEKEWRQEDINQYERWVDSESKLTEYIVIINYKCLNNSLNL